MTARFTQAPESHNGSEQFLLHLEFSHEPVKFSYRTVRDELFGIEGGSIVKARRLVSGRNLRWEITVVPAGVGAVTLTARATTDCAASHAVCDTDGRKFSGQLTLTVPGPAPVPVTSEPITASWVQAPEEHDGSTAFDLHMDFSHEPVGFSYRSITGGVVNVQGGTITRVWRRVRGRNQQWGVQVTPSGSGDVTVSVNGTGQCSEDHAVCDAAGRKLKAGAEVRIKGPVVLTVADADVEEADGATLDFLVTLSRVLSETVTVSYATSDSTASAGDDYTATSGTLTLQANESSKTISVPVLVDVHDEASETLTLTLSNPSPSRVQLADATATGTIRSERLAASKRVATESGLVLCAPNPFNSTTTIMYHLSSPGPVKLVIYNVLGQPVRTPSG